MHRALVNASDEAALEKIRGEVSALCEDFPPPGIRL